MLSDLVLTRTEGDKLREIFAKKFLGFKRKDEWVDYLADLDGVEYIYKFSEIYSDPLDHLFEFINERPGERFVIRDVRDRNYFILIEKELAQKILVLGSLP